jgi:hypothetical protein
MDENIFILSSLDKSNCNHDLDRAYFHICGEKNPKNMTQPSLTLPCQLLNKENKRKLTMIL